MRYFYMFSFVDVVLCSFYLFNVLVTAKDN